MTTAALLALFAGVLAWPAPRLLAAARWPHRCPRAAIVLWQAIGLAGGVSALLAAIAFTVSPLSTSTPSAIVDHVGNIAAGVPLDGLSWINLVGLAVATALAGRLFGVLAASTTATLRERHRHRHLVDLAGRRHRGHDTPEAHDHHGGDQQSGDQRGGASGRGVGGTIPGGCCLCEHRDRANIGLRILDHPIAVAYCVPGVRHARVVVSRGLLNTLDAAELDAVLAHEAAHVAGRHDLVIQPFVAWERTFPFLRPAREATAAVSLLVEMLADDAAARRSSRRALARALARLGVARAPVPAGALGINGPGEATASAQAPGTGTVTVPTRPSTSASTSPMLIAALPAVRPPAGFMAAGPAPGVASVKETAAVASGPRPGTANPVVSRISRLLDPPVVHWWQPSCAYLAAVVVLAAPPLIVLVG
ncbi:Peptidase family M48 [Frankia canadensis]|uniref:Peptidase family M48 n=1 Tax=Frankia canadensis TaxID=1836972 RepID=A0A2I2KRZ6_9ACTN|nr:M56 family metallopeptidase [Frankia canadensis]SNQ48441.1 Peptidase family M48 [Frankia canadensis]SOU55731.1 Peptidase family M48 [Frankia canadensis]